MRRQDLTGFLRFSICGLTASLLVFGSPPVHAEGTIAGVVSRRPFERLFTPESSRAPLALSAPAQDPAEKPPLPRHTGIQALIRATASDFNAFPRRKSTWVILGIGGGAALLTWPIDREVSDDWRAAGIGKAFRPGKLFGYGWVQAGAAVGTYVVGRYIIKVPEGKTNKVSHIGFDLLRANLLTQAVTYSLKFSIQRGRPTGECCSFPSGHAAVTFAAASVLERHFGYRGAWPTYALAAYVAMSRVFDGRHFPSDVLFGSAIGIAAGWTVVGRHGRSEYSLVPVPVRGGVAVMVAKVASSGGD